MIGYAEKVAAMKEAIMAIVASLEAHVFQDVLIAQKCHPVRPPSLLSHKYNFLFSESLDHVVLELEKL